jgi:chromosome segregation ATPase
MLNAQDNFNEPPTRSEFEQLKSKIQVYERNQIGFQAHMNSITSEIDTAFIRLDEMMQSKEVYLDSVVMNMALESQGLQAEAVSKFVSVDEVDALKTDIDARFTEKEEFLWLVIYIAGGLIVLLLLLVLFLFFTQGKKAKKAKEVHEELSGKFETGISEIKTEIESLKTEIESVNKEFTSLLNNEIDERKKSVENKISILSTNNDLAIKKQEEKTQIVVADLSVSNASNIAGVQDAFKNELSELKKEEKKLRDKEVKVLKKKQDDLSSKLDELESLHQNSDLGGAK